MVYGRYTGSDEAVLDMRITIRDLDNAFIEQFAQRSQGTSVEIICADIFSAPAAAIVSPANSFGNMGGGIDYAYKKRWPGIEELLQTEIRKNHSEILVGQAIAIETGDSNFPFLISAPTMRFPRAIQNYDDVYLATLAALRKAHSLKAESIVMPGMGTLTGRVPYDIAAKMMLDAVSDYRLSSEDLFDRNLRRYYQNL